MPKLFRRNSRSGSPSVSTAGNMVTEIVDQITEKQDRSFQEPATTVRAGEDCSACLEEKMPAAASYRIVLRCASDELAPTHDVPHPHGGRSDA